MVYNVQLSISVWSRCQHHEDTVQDVERIRGEALLEESGVLLVKLFGLLGRERSRDAAARADAAPARRVSRAGRRAKERMRTIPVSLSLSLALLLSLSLSLSIGFLSLSLSLSLSLTHTHSLSLSLSIRLSLLSLPVSPTHEWVEEERGCGPPGLVCVNSIHIKGEGFDVSVAGLCCVYGPEGVHADSAVQRPLCSRERERLE